MTLRLGGDGAITGCTSLENPDLTVSGLTISGSFDAEKVLVASGTAAAPSYTFSGDTDNGLYYAGTNSIGLATAGTNAILIDSSNRVGVGTSSPSVLLDVVGTSGSSTVAEFSYTGSNSVYLKLVNASNALGFIGYETQDLTFYTNNLHRMRIDSSGRLLVGTSSSSNLAKLVVQGRTSGTNTPGHILLKSDNTPPSADRGLSQIDFADTNEYVGAVISAASDGAFTSSSHPSRLMFSTTADGASSPTERMRIDSSGRLLVGTSSGQGKFIVQDSSLPKIQANYNGAAHIEFGVGGSGCGFTMTTGHFMSFNHQPYSDRGTDNNLTERMRILGTGGLTFNGDTAAANALDDYEEGTWTPVFVNGGTATYQSTTGHYVKIGNQCTIHVQIRIASIGTAAGHIRVSLPFAVENTNPAYGSVGTIHNNLTATNTTNNNGLFVPAQSYVDFYVGNTTNMSPMLHTDLGTGALIFGGTYITA